MKNKYVTPIVLLLLGIGLFISLYYVSIYIQPILLPSNNYRLVMIGVTFAASFTVLASIAGFLNDALGILDRIYPQANSQENTESLEQPNRRILLNHVENAWIKGVLDASLHGAALLDLGIKQDPKAVTKYPWAIKKESTNELLSEGTSILEIFDSIGMGRSLLILGAPGSGKTTMLLELARGLIARAREDITQPIPMVFNLASWTEKLTLADWLAHELNNLYSIPLKTATNWVKADRLLLLLDGLDELGKESYAKCVGAINQFRREHGLTSVVVCSRSQVYEGINTKLSLNGAIEVQPLTHMQVEEYIDNFGNQLASLRLALQKDTTLRKIAETPLFLSIMIVAYHGKQVVDISASTNTGSQHKHLFETYIAQMFERNRHTENSLFNTQEVLRWLSWLAHNMAIYNQMP
ncbi:MAG TPA: NACHT domain-containing protein, partial [Anaerolineales bacterium]|nr:NACHT domain-containing protein [Anaerolineales bacterium]